MEGKCDRPSIVSALQALFSSLRRRAIQLPTSFEPPHLSRSADYTRLHLKSNSLIRSLRSAAQYSLYELRHASL